MKPALTFVCSLLLLGTLFVPVTAAGVGAMDSTPACCDCNMPACCSADVPRPDASPASATPVSSSVHHQVMALASAIVAWTLPSAQICIPSFVSPQFHSEGAPLHARNCVYLI